MKSVKLCYSVCPMQSV